MSAKLQLLPIKYYLRNRHSNKKPSIHQKKKKWYDKILTIISDYYKCGLIKIQVSTLFLNKKHKSVVRCKPSVTSYFLCYIQIFRHVKITRDLVVDKTLAPAYSKRLFRCMGFHSTFGVPSTWK